MLLSVFLLSLPVYAADWARIDMSPNSGTHFFVDLDRAELSGGETFYFVQMIRPDSSFVDVRLSVSCHPPGHRIREITEFNDNGDRIAHYRHTDFRIEIKDEIVFNVLLLAACNGEKQRSLEEIRKIRGVREFVLGSRR